MYTTPTTGLNSVRHLVSQSVTQQLPESFSFDVSSSLHETTAQVSLLHTKLIRK